MIASAAGTSNSDVVGSKSVNMFRVKGGTQWNIIVSYLPKFTRDEFGGPAGDEFGGRFPKLSVVGVRKGFYR